MKIEKINNNQIRCTISCGDLEARHISMKELVFSTGKAKQLFAEMVESARRQFGFLAEDKPLVIEARPGNGEEINIIITKIDHDPVGAQLPQLRHLDMSDIEGLIKKTFPFLTGEQDEADDGMLQELEAEDLPPLSPSEMPKVAIFLYTSIQKAKEAARVIAKKFTGTANLYYRKKSNDYFLVLHRDDMSAEDFFKICNILTEYGPQIKEKASLEYHYREHYETVADRDAIGYLLTH